MPLTASVRDVGLESYPLVSLATARRGHEKRKVAAPLVIRWRSAEGSKAPTFRTRRKDDTAQAAELEATGVHPARGALAGVVCVSVRRMRVDQNRPAGCAPLSDADLGDEARKRPGAFPRIRAVLSWRKRMAW